MFPCLILHYLVLHTYCCTILLLHNFTFVLADIVLAVLIAHWYLLHYLMLLYFYFDIVRFHVAPF